MAIEAYPAAPAAPVTRSIRAKLFMTLLIASTISVAGMHAFMRWSFNNGLMELAESRQQERIDRISERLILRYREDGGWQRLAADKRLWVSALLGYGEGTLRSRTPPEVALSDGSVDRASNWLRHGLGEPGIWPPTRVMRLAQSPDGPPLRLEMRLMLLDADGELIYGRPELLEGSVRFPLRVKDERVGELTMLPGPYIPESGEVRFKERQTTSLIIIALGMIVLSAAFAFPLSKRLSRPVRSFQDTARSLAAGDFRARVPMTGEDELGRLGRDINALAESLERNEQARRRWVADISHELRTPLALLRAEIEALQDGVRTLNRAAVDSLHGDVLRLGRLVDDLYELSMTDLGALSYRKTETDPVEVLAGDVAAFRGRFTAARLTLELDGRLAETTTMNADEHRLSQLFRNLLRNSLQYTDPGGTLSVRAATQKTQLVIDFEDSAPGVPPEALPHLFERLYRAETSRSRNTGGAGLGLAICRNIAEAHGGSIEARPSARGGLWIQIRLPTDN
jgi:two-component system sensor histidine kinase BaeS